MRELKIQDIFGILLKWLAVIIIVPIIIASVTAVIYYTSVSDTYQATAVMYVLATRGEGTNQTWDSSTSTQLASDYQSLIKAHEITTETAERLGMPNLGVSVSVNAVGNSTRVLNLTCSGTDPDRCALVANTIGDVFAAYLQRNDVSNAVKIWSYATVPKAPYGPNRVRAVMTAFLTALVVCIGGAFAIELLNTTFKSEAEVEEALDSPVLASIEGYRVELEKYRAATKEDKRSLLRTVNEVTRESIKTLATNIQFCEKSQEIRSLTITSTQPSEGKTSIGVMLGTVFAEEGKNVLIVDMDFRNPDVGRLLKHRSTSDLVNYFNGECSLDEIITPCDIDGLFFIDSFHRNTVSANIIRIDAFQQFLKDVSAVFDMVIFDTPPIGLYIDAAVLSSKTDATIMVVGCGETGREPAQEAVTQLRKANGNLIGVAFNFIQRKPGRGYYYYRYYKHYQYKNYHNYSNPNRREKSRHSSERWDTHSDEHK